MLLKHIDYSDIAALCKTPNGRTPSPPSTADCPLQRDIAADHHTPTNRQQNRRLYAIAR